MPPTLPDDVICHILNRPWSVADVWLVSTHPEADDSCIASRVPGCIVGDVFYCQLQLSSLRPAPLQPDFGDGDGDRIFLAKDGRTLVVAKTYDDGDDDDDGAWPYCVIGAVRDSTLPAVRVRSKAFADAPCNALLYTSVTVDEEADEDDEELDDEVRARPGLDMEVRMCA
jgi:hypothetical protein